MKSPPLFIIVLLIISLSINAEITTDGSLGSRANLSGPNYLIRADLGHQMGGNLFHSFQDFNLNSLESATFSGPNNVSNIISRVTGGNPSNIDGLIRSTIPNADMYFLNPYGIMFGPNARLDVQGSFHASTADYLRLGENGRFDARNPSDSLLTIAPIESFGFLDNPHGSIQVNGRGVLNESGTPRALLQVPDGKSLSLIGGDIHLSQGVDELPLEGLIDDTPEEIRAAQYRDQRFSQLYASGGTLNLASIRQAGEIALTKNGIHSTATKGGTIQLEQESYISSTGESGGNVFIRAGEFTMDNSRIVARTLGVEDGGVVDIQANNIIMDNGSIINGGTENLGDGTDIHLTAGESIRLLSHSPLKTASGNFDNINQQLGNAGDIRLQAKNIEINLNYGNGGFQSDTYGTGRGGDISFIAENRLDLINILLHTTTWGQNEQAGQSGDIYLHAKTVNVDQGSFVATSGGRADAGQLVIEAGTIYLGGLRGSFSALATYNITQKTDSRGNSGSIIIRADELLLENGAYLISSNFAEGDGGQIDIQLTGSLTVRGASSADGWATGIFSSVVTEQNQQGGKAGNIHIRAQAVRVEEGGRIDAGSKARHPSGSSRQAGNITLDAPVVVLSGVNPYGENNDGFGSVVSARSQGEHAGQAGNIQINASSVDIIDGALIESGSDNNSRGGNIQIQALEQINIQGDASRISLQAPLETQQSYLSNTNPENYNQSISGVYAHATSQAANSGDAGNIEVSTSYLHLSQGGQISTVNQGGGKAGSIMLNVAKLTLSDHALIRSDSALENQFSFDNVQLRDTQILSLGTVVKTADIDDGKAVYQINLGNILVRLIPVTQVADRAALEALPTQVIEAGGDIVQVADAGNGQAARFIYATFDTSLKSWRQINENSRIVLSHPDTSLKNLIRRVPSQVPYADGTLIHVNDEGNGKAADYVYTVISEGADAGTFYSKIYRVKYYQVADNTALQTLTNSTDTFVGMQVDVAQAEDGLPARFVFDGTDWVRYGEVLEVPDIAARENLILAKPGHIAHLPEGDTIYTSSEWIDLGQTYRVNNLVERNALNNIKQGDLVKVADTGNGRHDAFIYADDQWIKQIRGGDAGQIIINADSIQLTDGSEISTGSISGGGGSVTLNVDKMVFLNNSQVSTSVQEGVGNGGDLSLNPEFVILENGKIIARANEGQGGNINITTKGIYTFPPKSASTIDASSKLGIDGVVHIESPDVDVSGALLGIPAEFFDASNKLESPCTIAQIQNPNTFIVKRVGGSAPLPSDWQSNQLVLVQPEDEQKPNSKTKTPSPITSLEVTEQLALKVALLTGCQSGF
jgi:filamentous hemagglutinin family protein